MFVHNFKYTLKILFKSKALIFWTFAFPLILGTFFYMAFSNIENSEQFKVFDIAVIKTDEFNNNEIIKETIKYLSDEDNEEQLFNTQYVDESKAQELLEDKEIVGYVEFGDKTKIVVNSSGADETVLKFVVDEINSQITIINNMITRELSNRPIDNYETINYEELYNKAYELYQKDANIKDISRENLSYTMIEFYTLIAMTCLYGGILGMVAINNSLANMSKRGARLSVSPNSKATIILSSTIASYLVELIGLALLYVYTILVLDVDYGNNFPLIVLLSLVGSFAGLSLGIAVATLLKTNENIKTGILISLTMLGCFLSGMMGITMKYLVDKNAPIVNMVNPANMITDGLYSLYYYDTLDRFYFNIISLVIFSLVLLFISIMFLRRQKYDSI